METDTVQAELEQKPKKQQDIAAIDDEQINVQEPPPDLNMHKMAHFIQHNSDRTIYVGGIPDRIKEDDMLAIFGSFGVIHHVNLPTDPETGMHTDKLNQNYHPQGRQKGFAFIEYEEIEDMEEAIFNFNNSELLGKVIRVKKAKPPKRKPEGKAVWHIQQVDDEEL